jgi:ABC-2 type transport system permease protein
MFLVEILKAWRRPRTWVLGSLLAAVAILPVIVLATSPTGNGGPPFFDQIRNSGLFASLAALALIQPFILPLGAGLLSGESIAYEASNGTLRYVLVRPVGRVRLILTKYGSVMALLATAILWVLVVGLVAGGLAFGFGQVPTLSGTTLTTGQAFLRVAASAGYVIAGMTGLAAVGMLISTLTDSAPGATVAVMAIAIVSQILDGIDSLRWLHPYLISHDWLRFVDLFRAPIAWDGIAHGMKSFVLYTVIFLGASIAVFRRKDVVS